MCVGARIHVALAQNPHATREAGRKLGMVLRVIAMRDEEPARDANLPMPAAIVAFSPGLDATRTGESMDTKAGIDPFFTRETLGRTGAMYLAGQDPNHDMLSPAVRDDLTG